MNIWKNTTKAQRDVKEGDKNREETAWEVGQVEADSLTNTRGSSNSSNTQVYYKLYVCILDVLYKALKYRIIFKTLFTAAGQRETLHECVCVFVCICVFACKCVQVYV